MARIKILFLLKDYEHGGIPRVLANLLEQIDVSRVSVDLFACNPAGIFIDGMKNCSILPADFLTRLLTCNYRKEHGVVRVLAILLKMIRHGAVHVFHKDVLLRFAEKRVAKHFSGQYDVAWACSEETPGKIAQRIQAAQKILWIHNCCDETCFENMKKAGIPDYQAFDRIVCVADHVAESLKTNLKNLYHLNVDSKISVMRNIVNQTEILKAGTEKLDDPQFKRDGFTIVSVGRLAYEKRLEVIPEMAASLKAQGAKFRWYLIGDGADVMKEWLRREIRKWKVEEQVILLGIRKNPYPYTAQSDLLVLTSRQEAYPTVVNEAQALGTYVVVADINGMSEIVRDGHGCIVPIAAMSDKILEIMQLRKTGSKVDFTEHNKKVLNDFYRLIGVDPA